MIEKIPVYIVSGMLGAGKTSFIKRLMRHGSDHQNIKVIVSEASPLGVDQLTLGLESPEDLVAGCVCCVGFDAALKTLLRVSEGVDSETTKVILETSGISDPTTLLFELSKDPRFSQRFCINGVITLVDCVNASVQSDRYREWSTQVQLSDAVLLTHLDSIRPSERSGVIQLLKQKIFSKKAAATIYGLVPEDNEKLITDIKSGVVFRKSQVGKSVIVRQDNKDSTHDGLLCTEIEFETRSSAADVLAFCQAVTCMAPTLARMKLLVAASDYGDFYLGQIVMGKVQALESVSVKSGLTRSRLYIIDDHVRESQISPMIELFFDTQL